MGTRATQSLIFTRLFLTFDFSLIFIDEIDVTKRRQRNNSLETKTLHLIAWVLSSNYEMCSPLVNLIVGIVFSCLLFLMQIVLFCDIDCHGGYCGSLYDGTGSSAVQATRAFHILAFICITTLTSADVGFSLISAAA